MPEHVPTVAELAAEGLAFPIAFDTKHHPTHWRLTPEGEQRINDAMQRRVAEHMEQIQKDRDR